VKPSTPSPARNEVGIAINTEDEKWMRAALEQARSGLGWTSPRPSVGCVIVKNGKIIGAGSTVPGDGNPHAEVVALEAARSRGESTPGATAYVTLEPCSHFATTPPCTNALIEAGIQRVVAGVRDPNPAIDGRGYEQLRAAGVEVKENFLADECARVHDQFLKHISQKAPFVTLKIAASLDGKIAMPSGESQWITDEAARQRAHLLRHQHDAVLVGIETVLSDDPQLNVRLDETSARPWKQPIRVVLDSKGRVPLDARVLQGASRAGSTPGVIIATTKSISAEKTTELEARGALILQCGVAGERVGWSQLLKQLYERGVTSILIEGGASVASSALRKNVVDKIIWFVAPILIGAGRDALQEYSRPRLADAPRLHNVQIEQIGEDVMWSGYLKKF
jgi:diaminohydroxyphosphoribosylaminopyrimidine deaminase/5-amino-6-(5-phosphoribosylamino)uracil reductase